MTARQVSLNIHDPLTFEGTEICLHPDLGKFAVGDLVEICVWDTTKQKAKGVYHRRQKSSSSVLQTSIVNHNASLSTASPPGATNSSNSSNTDQQQQQPQPPPSVKSVEEELRGEDLSLGGGAASTASGDKLETVPLFPTPNSLPAKTVTLTNEGGLPPVPPNKGGGKPPLIQRRVTTTGATRKAPRHVRDLSDVTVDSIGWADLPTSPEDDNQQNSSGILHPLRLSFTMLVSENSLKSLKGSARTQVSILRQVADLYHLSSYDVVSVQKVEDDDADLLESSTADFVLVTFKDQFISRGEMHLFQETLVGSWVYEGKRLHEQSRGFQATAREIRHSDQRTVAGLITEKTKITFRSRSARIIWLVQLSAEMWDYASPYEKAASTEAESVCELYFDRWISFVHQLFDKWKEMETSHSLTVVFFSRSFLSSKSVLDNGPRDVYGRLYEDHYRVVLENETRPNWHSLIVWLKEAFVSYPSEVGWTVDDTRNPSNASRGNVLEAVNVTLNMLQYHFLDRDLYRTGNSLVVVSAGNGVFEVDKGLARTTYQRMLDNGIGSDMLSLGLPALHIAPFFIYTVIDGSDEGDDDAAHAQDYEVPHWMHLSFVSYESESWVFVDHLIEKEDVVIDRNVANNNNELRVGPNGFLMGRAGTGTTGSTNVSTSPRLRPSSALWFNSPTLPTSKVNKAYNTRKLIEGRDFRDILDACRPRDFGKLPSALRALLKIHNATNNVMEAPEIEKKRADSHDVQEWGALGAGARSARFPRRTMSLGHESDGPSPGMGVLPSSPPVRGLMRFCDTASSHSSSCGSHSSLSLWGRGAGATTTLQLQRSLSFDTTGTGDCSNGSFDEEDSKNFDTVENIRKMMDQHDRVAARASAEEATYSPTVQHDDSQRVIQRKTGGSNSRPRIATTSNRLDDTGNATHQTLSSGIDAALKQYRTFGPQKDNRVQLMTRSGSMGRMGLTTNNPSSFRRFSQFAGSGLSPLLLPPVITPGDAPDAIPGDFKQPLFPYERTRSNVSEQQLGKSPEISVNGRNDKIREGVFGRAAMQSPTRKKSTGLGTPPRNDDMAGRLLGISPPTISGMTSEHRNIALSISPPRSPPKDLTNTRSKQRGGSILTKHPLLSRRKKALNPFRQQDEDEVLMTKSFNRRRWSHVFPRGEVEFKRHAGPNWKSLTAPAILPLGVDYFPTRDALNFNYAHNHYTLTLSEFPHNNYTSHRDLLGEMVRQRLSQDFQLVDPSIVDPNFFTYRREVVNRSADAEIVRFFLSMGHRLQVLTYDPSVDRVEVESYTSKQAQKHDPLLRYQYYCFCQETQSYQKMVQSFSKYANIYLWNLVDRIVCGNPDREMRDGMRVRSLMFGIIPDNFENQPDDEAEYLKKFERLMEYFEKLRDKESESPPLKVKIVSGANREPQKTGFRTESKPGVEGSSMIRFYVQLRKGKRDIWEWMEVAADATLDTTWSYRIIFSWLVGSSGRVDTQVQSLKRRCKQFGLRLIPFPHISASRNPFLQSFKAPAIFTLEDPSKAEQLDLKLTSSGYIHDGVFKTDHTPLLDCIGKTDAFKFKSTGFAARFVTGRQLVHRTGTLFVRILTDTTGRSIAIVLGNYRFLKTSKDNTVHRQYKEAFSELEKCLRSVQ